MTMDIPKGASLKTYPPEKIAQWLGVPRVLYGHLSAFDDVKLGVIGHRAVGGDLSLWDQSKQGMLWSNSAVSSNSSTVRHLRGKDIIGDFLGQIGRSWWEQLRHKPLAEESIQFVQQVLTFLFHNP